MIHNRKVAAIICLHFGLPFLEYAMRSILDVADAFYIMYSPVANHGTFVPGLVCPESREDLIEAAFSVAPDQTRWFDYAQWQGEGAQFKAGYDLAIGYDVVVKLDADELWAPGLLADAIGHGIEQQAHEIRVPLVHYWRSFHKGFTHDPAAPGRIYLREFSTGETTYTPPDAMGRIQHFGYALPVNLMRYKWQTHGHGPEFRKDVNWFDDIYAANRQFDCHPVGSQYWMEAEDIVPPMFLQDHPYANLSLIE